ELCFPSSAACIAELTGFAASLVLFTLPSSSAALKAVRSAGVSMLSPREFVWSGTCAGAIAAQQASSRLRSSSRVFILVGSRVEIAAVDSAECSVCERHGGEVLDAHRRPDLRGRRRRHRGPIAVQQAG